jgi:hypothetical protein
MTSSGGISWGSQSYHKIVDLVTMFLRRPLPCVRGERWTGFGGTPSSASSVYGIVQELF